MDVSEGGLCLFSPVCLDAKSKIEIVIDVPGFPESVVKAEVWHVRRQRLRNSKRKIWVIGAVLEKSDDAYLRLLAADSVVTEKAPLDEISRTGTAFSSTRPTRNVRVAAPQPLPSEPADDEDAPPQVFRVRVQSRTGPRTRLLTIAGESEQDAQSPISSPTGKWSRSSPSEASPLLVGAVRSLRVGSSRTTGEHQCTHPLAQHGCHPRLWQNANAQS